MTSRARLPNRRAAAHLDFRHGNADYVASIGFYPDGSIGEAFLRCRKIGSHLDVSARDASILLSLLRQYGCSLNTIQHALTKDENGAPSGPLGQLLELLREPT